MKTVKKRTGDAAVTTIALLLGVLCLLTSIAAAKHRAQQGALSAPSVPQVGSEWPSYIDQPMRSTEDLVDQWLQSLGVSSMPQWYHVVDGDKACRITVEHGTSFYCPQNAQIYIPESAYTQNQVGNAYMASHEASHHLQNLAKNIANNPRHEQQASCGAGVFVRWARDNGLFGESSFKYANDLYQLETAVYNAKDDNVHGPGSDTFTAFDTGYQSGSLKACIPLAGPLAGV